MKKKRVVDLVREILEPHLNTLEVELVDVEFVKEGPYRYLRVTIDNDQGISLDDCQKVSQCINSELDQLDPIEEQYFLEVTSPGVERILKRDAEFVKFKDHEVQVNLFQSMDGQKIFVGKLVGLIDDHIVLLHETMGEVKIPKSKVSLTKLVVDFDREEDK